MPATLEKDSPKLKNFGGYRSKSGVVAQPVKVSYALQERYRKRLNKLIDEMTASTLYWLKAAYKRNLPEITGDESPVNEIKETFGGLLKRWLGKFMKAAAVLATGIVVDVSEDTTARLKTSFKNAVGVAPMPKKTRAFDNKIQAAIAENVALIKTIPEKYFRDIEVLVYQSVSEGRDIQYLTEQLQERYKVTRNRAKIIAYDQVAKINETIAIQRAEDLGVKKGIWLHSGAGKEPRQSHVKANGDEFDLDKGKFIDNEWILPGQKINCRCTFLPVVPLFGG